MQNNPRKQQTIFPITQITILGTIFYTTILILGISVGFVLRIITYIILIIKHKHKFCGLMKGNDRIWALEDKSKSRIMMLIVFDYDSQKNGDIIQRFKPFTNSEDLKIAYPKLTYRRKNFLGYDYFLKQDEPLDIVEPMRDYNDIEDLRRLISEYASEPIGTEDDGMIEVKIGTKPLKWKGNGNKKLYPLLFKLHHSIGDGIALNNLLIYGYGENSINLLKDTYCQKLKDVKKYDHKINHKHLLYYLNEFVNSKLYYNPLLENEEPNILHGPNLSGLKNVAWKTEIFPEYVQKVKNIKNHAQTSFNNVIFTALSASLNNYYNKVGKVPNMIKASFVVLPRIPKLEEQMIIEDDKIVSMDTVNKFTVLFLKLSMNFEEDVGKNILMRLKQVSLEASKLSNSIDYYYHSLNIKYLFPLLPSPLLRMISQKFQTTFAVSNLPGWDKMRMFHGGEIHDIFFWIPNFQKNGIGISIFTYDNRFQLGLVVDKVLIPNPEDVQGILDDVFKYIDVLDDAIKNANYVS